MGVIKMAKTTKRPTVSIICRTYNQRDIAPLAIQSALNQTFSDFELIIIDDASTDGTYDEIQKFTDKRITHVIHHDTNQGDLYGMNQGLALARGKYICSLDGDDQWMPEKLQIQVDFLDNNPQYGAVFSYIEPIGDMSDPRVRANCELFKKIINNPGATRAQMLRKYFSTKTFVCFPTELWRAEYTQMFNPAILALCETNFHISTLLKTNMYVLEMPLVKYGVGANYDGKWASNQSLISELYFILDRFLEIQDTDLFCEIFADDLRDIKTPVTKELIPYFLTKIAEKYPETSQWSNWNLHRFISNSKNLETLQNTLHLTHRDFLTLKRGAQICDEITHLYNKYRKYKRLFNVTLMAFALSVLFIIGLIARPSL